jgi:hypothetical protein
VLIAIHSLLGDVNVTPTTSGMPGAELVQKLLNWLTQIELWGLFFLLFLVVSI